MWFEIYKDQHPQRENNIVGNFEPKYPKNTLGEITLEDFLVKAGVVKESSQGSSKNRAITATQQCVNVENDNICLELDHQCGMKQIMGSEFSIHNNAANNVSEFQMFGQNSVIKEQLSNNMNEIEKCHSVTESSKCFRFL